MILNKKDIIDSIYEEIDIAKHEIKNNNLDLSHLYPNLKSAIIESVLLYTRGNQAEAARLLGITRTTVSSTYKKANIIGKRR